MRWPWSRRDPEPAPATSEPAAPAAPSPSAGAAATAAPAPSPMGWAFLPPIQRTLAAPVETVTRPAAFPTELTAWRSPSFTSSLSHAVVDTAPSGVIDGDGAGLGGVGHPLATSAPGPELTLLPPPRPTAVQRAARTTATPAVPLDPPPAPPEPAAAPRPSLTRAPAVGMPVVHRAVVPGVTTAPEVAVAASAPAPEPESVVEVEAGELSTPSAPTASAVPEPSTTEPAATSGEPPAAPLLGGTPAAAPPALTSRTAPPVQRAADAAAPPLSPAHPSFDRTGTTPGAAGSAHESFDRTGTAPGEAGSVPGSFDRTDPVGVESVMEIPETPAAPAVVQRSRPRLGFGPPLTSVPATAVPEPPAPLDRATPAPGAGGFTEVPVQRATSEPAPTSSSSPSSPSPPPSLVLAPATPATTDAPIQRSVDDGAQVADDVAPAGHAAHHAEVSGPDGPTEPTEPPGSTAPTATDGEPEATPEPMQQVALEPPGVLPAPPTTLASVPLPLGPGLTTSIQRSTVLPGPGTPSPSLVVRPASPFPTPPSRERVVPIQRLPAVEPPAPPPSRPGTADPAVQRHATTSAPTAASTPGPGPMAGPAAGPTTPLNQADLAGPRPAGLEPIHGSVPGLAHGVLDVPVPETPGPVLVARATSAPDVPPRPVPPPVAAAVRPAVPASVGQASLTLARSAVEAAGPAATSATTTPHDVGPSAHSRMTGPDEAPEPVDVVVARAAEDPGSEGSTGPAAPGVAAGGRGAGGGGGGGAGGAPGGGDVEAMAHQLFPPLLRRLKNELLLDRERRGTRTDAW